MWIILYFCKANHNETKNTQADFFLAQAVQQTHAAYQCQVITQTECLLMSP